MKGKEEGKIEALQFWTKVLERGQFHLFEFDWRSSSTTGCYSALTYGLVRHFATYLCTEQAALAEKGFPAAGSSASCSPPTPGDARLIFWCADQCVECLVPPKIRRLANDRLVFTKSVTREDLKDTAHTILVLVSLSPNLCRRSEFLDSLLLPALLFEKPPQNLTIVMAIRPLEFHGCICDSLRSNATSCWTFISKSCFVGWTRVPLRGRCVHYGFECSTEGEHLWRLSGKQLSVVEWASQLDTLPCLYDARGVFSKASPGARLEPYAATVHTEPVEVNSNAKMGSVANLQPSTETKAEPLESFLTSLPFRVSLSEREERSRSRLKLPFEHFDESTADAIIKSPEGFVIFENAEADEPGSDPEISSDEDLDV
jgi:hypothetical protein